MNTSSVLVRNISKSYKSGKSKVEALNDISLNINEGELFGLIGPDGAGKTTLFRVLTTLLLADSGKATVGGLDVVENFKQIRSHIGYMPGRFSLYQDMTIEENLRFFADVFGTTLEANYDTIKDIYVQIEPFKKRRAGNLSGGMKQKLALCCALIHKPRILFLDEPTTGVDAVSRKEFWIMLKQLKAQGMTILVSTPYMDEASMCDRIALIQSGQILSVDTPGGILQKYPYQLYGMRAPNTYHLLEYLKQCNRVKMCYISGEYIHVVLKDEIKELEFEGLEQIILQPTIEDCFIQLMTDESN